MVKKAFTGRAYLLGNHINTDILHPPDYFSLQKDRIASGLSRGCHDTFLVRLKKGDILVGGRNFGCGSSRESSARSFQYNGVEVIVAESFARIFFRNLTNQGIYLVTCPDIIKRAVHGETLLIDLEHWQIKSKDRGWELACVPFPHYVKRVLEAGGMFNFLKARLSEKNKE